MNELALFAGAGGGILGGKLLGWRTVCAVEIEEYPRKVLMQRQNDGILDPFPIWDDICTFDGKPWRGVVDVVSGGFPCQDISAAGKGAGLAGERSGLWSEMARVVSEVRPAFVFVENSERLVRRGLDTVLSDLAALGYDVRWGIVGGKAIGARCDGKRCWILASSDKGRTAMRRDGLLQEDAATRAGRGNNRNGEAKPSSRQWWQEQSQPAGVVDDLADRVDRIGVIGNGQIPSVATLAWRLLGGPVSD